MRERDLFPGVRRPRRVATLHLPMTADEFTSLVHVFDKLWPGCVVEVHHARELADATSRADAAERVRRAKEIWSAAATASALEEYEAALVALAALDCLNKAERVDT